MTHQFALLLVLLMLLLLLLLAPTMAQQVASSPGVLQFALLTKELPGTLRETAVDTSGNLYAAGRHSSSAFVSKRSPSFNRLWATELPALPDTSPALAFSDTGGLFAIAPRLPSHPNPESPDSSTIADIILYELDTMSGDVLSSALVERVQLPPNSRLRCILASAAPNPPLVYVTYIVQDGVAPSTARTRVVQMARGDTGAMSPAWTRVLTDQGREATSVGIAEDKASRRIVVVEISSKETGAVTDRLAAYTLDMEGTVMHSSTANAASDAAWIADVAADENGVLYVGEGPELLHRVALRALDGEDLLTKLWNVTETEVVDMTVLKNGTAVYVLSNGEGFRNEGMQVVRTKIPILSVYNASGHTLFKSEYTESVPDAEREMYSFSLIDPENKCDAILGGFLRLADAVARESEVSIGLFTFPNLMKGSQGQDDSQLPVPIDPNSPNTPDPQTSTTLIVIGASVGVVVFLTIVAVALFIIYRNNRSEAEEARERAQVELEADKYIEDIPSLRASLRDNNINVLV